MSKNILQIAAFVILTAPIQSVAQIVTGQVVDLPGYAFKYSLHTSASKATIWKLWTDVENWKRFDRILDYSYLVDDEQFGEGATGYINAKGAPRTRFEILQVTVPDSFTVQLKLPLYQKINQQRYFEVFDSGDTVFTHEIHFKGGLSAITYALLGSIYKNETQKVMERLKLVAERQQLCY